MVNAGLPLVGGGPKASKGANCKLSKKLADRTSKVSAAAAASVIFFPKSSSSSSNGSGGDGGGSLRLSVGFARSVFAVQAIRLIAEGRHRKRVAASVV